MTGRLLVFVRRGNVKVYLKFRIGQYGAMKIAFTFYVLVFLAGLMGCVSGDERAYMNILQVDGAMSLDLAMAADASIPTDMGTPLEAIPSGRNIWLVVDQENPHLGFRGLLRPPHESLESTEELLDRLSPAGHLVVWDGPDTARDQLLRRLWQTRANIAPLYIGPPTGSDAARINTIRADLRLLVAEVWGRANSLKKDDLPVIGLDLTEHLRRDWPLISETLAESGQPVYIVAHVSSDDLPMAGLNLYWHSCASEIVNPVRPLPDKRLGCIAGGYGPTGRESDVIRRIHRARWQVDLGHHLLLVDGLGRWQFDRQMDPVIGEQTTLPTHVTGGRPVQAYGQTRMKAILRLTDVASGLSDTTVFEAPTLLKGVGQVTVQSRPNGITLNVTSDSAILEIVLNDDPLNVRQGTEIQIEHLPRTFELALIFADGQKIFLSDVASGTAWVQIAPDHHRRLEDVYLVYTPDPQHRMASIEGVKIRQASGPLDP
jgi:hypothetical protein